MLAPTREVNEYEWFHEPMRSKIPQKITVVTERVEANKRTTDCYFATLEQQHNFNKSDPDIGAGVDRPGTRLSSGPVCRRWDEGLPQAHEALNT